MEWTVPGQGVLGLVREVGLRRQSGVLTFSAGDLQKTLTLQAGRVCAAQSSLIDDRMGEVMYREGRLNLEVFVSVAGSVTATQRFGDQLVAGGHITGRQLWQALAAQGREIVQSLLYYPHLQVSWTPSQVLSVRSDYDLQRAIGELTQQWEERRAQTALFEHLARNSPGLAGEESGQSRLVWDFHRDLAALVNETPSFVTVVESSSRLTAPYTVRALFELVRQGAIRDTWGLWRTLLGDGEWRLLRASLEEYSLVFAELRRVCTAAESPQTWHGLVESLQEFFTIELGLSRPFLSETGALPLESWSAACCTLPPERDSKVSRLRPVLHRGVAFAFFHLGNQRKHRFSLDSGFDLLEELTSATPVV